METKASLSDALKKITKYCAYQDRCHLEVRNKLFELKVYGEDADDIFMYLIRENFLNEERFAYNFARGKCRIKHWGNIKIKAALQQKQITEKLIDKALAAIDPQEYHAILKQLIEKKLQNIEKHIPFEAFHKVYTHLVQKGFEPELVKNALNKEQLAMNN